MTTTFIRSCCASALVTWLSLVATAGVGASELDGGGDDQGCLEWGLNLWGLSYHPDRTKNYDEHNWGVGLSCYTRPDFSWLLGNGRDNRLVFEADAMVNSWRGVVAPASIGANYRLKTFASGCKVFAVAALTAAYYNNPVRHTREVDWGPIPGVAFGCDAVRTNLTLVPSRTNGPLAVAIASVSLVF